MGFKKDSVLQGLIGDHLLGLPHLGVDCIARVRLESFAAAPWGSYGCCQYNNSAHIYGLHQSFSLKQTVLQPLRDSVRAISPAENVAEPACRRRISRGSSKKANLSPVMLFGHMLL